MRSITQILGGCQMLFGISYDIQEIFESYVTDEHRAFIQMLRVIEESLPLCDCPAMWWVSRRYEKGSIIITSNRPFSDWPKFHDTRATEETVDKLVHHSTIITIKGPSYRLREKLNQMEPLSKDLRCG